MEAEMGVPKIRNLIIKVTHACNIHCSYCYVARTRECTPEDGIMTPNIVRRVVESVADYLRTKPDIDRFVFYWHGGEPLLAGHSFFRSAFELQQELLPKNVQLVNTIQTNGILLDRGWLRLLDKIGYGLCLSLDGPAPIHDVRRRSKNDKGTYHAVCRAIRLMHQNGWPVSLLAVITPEALRHGRECYYHFRELGCTWMDFMYPFCSRLDNTMDEPIEPSRWGAFLCDVFDAWIEEGNPSVYIRQLHDWCMAILGGRTAMCTSQTDCSYVITIEPEGSIHTCDDLMAYCESNLGDIAVDSLDTVASCGPLALLSRFSHLYGPECTSCDIFEYCRGGCTLFRAKGKGDFGAKHFFCDSQKQAIQHIRRRLVQPHGSPPLPSTVLDPLVHPGID